MKKTFRLHFVLLASCLYSSVACNKLLDVQPEDKLVPENRYRDVYDADAAVIGIYGKLMGLAKQYLVLNELRADLMEVTETADEYLKQLNTHSVTEDNPYADPRPFYEVIVNCNDVLKNFDIMLQGKRLKDVEYQQRYSDVGAIRSWLYLQLGIHFGTVPYVTDPVTTIKDLKDASKFTRIPFNQLLDSLVKFTESLPYKGDYPNGTTLQTTVDGYSTQKFFINKNILLGDLYLWKGEYKKAATSYRVIMETATNNGATREQYYDQYRVRFAEVVNNNDIAVGYIRGRENDIQALIENNSQGWRSLFARGQDNLFNWEWIWVLPFDDRFAPGNPFIDLFANRGGRYQVKPSQQAMDNWNSQVQNNNFPFDARGRFTWKMIDGQPVIMKYLYNYVDPVTYTPISVLEKNGKWFLTRATSVHLHFAEAANMDGRHKLAYALVNQGILTTFDPTPGVSGRDVTNIMCTFDEKPYDFFARNGEFPRFRDDWHRNAGVRGRAYLRPQVLNGDSTVAVEDGIISEAALELAYEGQRWPDLLRVALRRNDPAYLADKIYNKLLKDNQPQAAEVRAKLMNMQNWYLPFKMQ